MAFRNLKVLTAILCSTLIIAQTWSKETDETYDLDPVRISATRELPAFDTENELGSYNAVPPNSFGIHLSNGNDISELMSRYSGYSAFRRTASSSAHPTTQGIRLRHLGANATSRALLLLDGVPQNDPFGGWVYWHRYHEDMLENININASGGGEAWGNFGSGGVISLNSMRNLRPRYRATLQAGSRDTYSLSFSASQDLGDQAMLDLGGKFFSTDGFDTVQASQRGPIDQAANSESSALRGRIRWNAANDWHFAFSLDAFEEERSNGTPLAANDTDAFDVSFVARKDLGNEGSHMNFTVYSQERDFANVFTAVDAQRASERPALNQFDVPADSAGFSISYLKTLESKGFLLIGADHRIADGEVNELFRNLGTGFTRSRNAGGEQAFSGLFATFRQEISEANGISASLRFDRVDQNQGSREEFDLETDTRIRFDQLSDTTDDELSIALAWYHYFDDNSTIRLKGLSGFRAPTLNELYRPFRVRNDITEANPELSSERFNGLELSWSSSPGEEQSYIVSIFHYEIDDIIANAFLSNESGFNALCGFVPNGGSCSQRRNLEESRISGLEARWRRDFNGATRGELTYLYSDSEIESAEIGLGINGNELPHAPAHRLNATFSWLPNEDLDLWTSLSIASKEYEDTRNTRRIDSFMTFDIGARYAISDQHYIGIRIENLFDEEVNTGVASNGLRTIGAPRGAWLTWNFVK